MSKLLFVLMLSAFSYTPTHQQVLAQSDNMCTVYIQELPSFYESINGAFDELNTKNTDDIMNFYATITGIRWLYEDTDCEVSITPFITFLASLQDILTWQIYSSFPSPNPSQDTLDIYDQAVDHLIKAKEALVASGLVDSTSPD